MPKPSLAAVGERVNLSHGPRVGEDIRRQGKQGVHDCLVQPPSIAYHHNVAGIGAAFTAYSVAFTRPVGSILLELARPPSFSRGAVAKRLVKALICFHGPRRCRISASAPVMYSLWLCFTDTWVVFMPLLVDTSRNINIKLNAPLACWLRRPAEHSDLVESGSGTTLSAGHTQSINVARAHKFVLYRCHESRVLRRRHERA